MDTRNTRQKALILETLEQDKTHPTVQELYDNLTLSNSSIGQATVYRNVNSLVKEKKIKCIFLPNQVIRYDANMESHVHLSCEKCGRLVDLYDDSYLSLQKKVMKSRQVEIHDTMVVFTGVCHECLLHK